MRHGGTHYPARGTHLSPVCASLLLLFIISRADKERGEVALGGPRAKGRGIAIYTVHYVRVAPRCHLGTGAR